MKLGYCTITWGGLGATPQGIGSIADLFYQSRGDVIEASRYLAEVGYSAVEIFDGNLLEVADVAAFREFLRETGLELAGVYTGANFIFTDALDEELAKIERAAVRAAECGAKHLIIGGGARRTGGARPEDYELLGSALDRVVEIAERHGLIAGYHPHLGTAVETSAELAEVFKHTRISFAPDVGHLAAAGADPIAELRRYADRLSYVHLKDYDPQAQDFVPLGAGTVDLPGVLATLRELNYEGWAMVELDSYPGDPREAARICWDFLSDNL